MFKNLQKTWRHHARRHLTFIGTSDPFLPFCPTLLPDLFARPFCPTLFARPLFAPRNRDRHRR